MAATRLIAMHRNKRNSVAKSLSDRLHYAQNPLKTQGEYISSFACNPHTVVQDFLLSRKQYLYAVGNPNKHEIIAYQIRQSFKPGEISPDEANRLGYELAMRFTKGQHSFTVSTHTDREHIHNHIIFNSINIKGTAKFKNFYHSALALQKVSDILCFENGYSIIQKKPILERAQRTDYPKRHTHRNALLSEIDQILRQNPKDFEAFLQCMKDKGYEIKYGKHIAVKSKNQKRFIRFSSLGEGYSEEALKEKIANIQHSSPEKTFFQKKKSEIDLLLDIQEKALSKGKGYEYWARKFNLKTTAKTLLLLQEQNIHSYEELEFSIKNAEQKCHALRQSFAEKESRIKSIDLLKNHIFTYSKTRAFYKKYAELTGKKQMEFYELHRAEIEKHREAKQYFNSLPKQKIPTVEELNEERSKLIAEQKQQKELYANLHKLHKDLSNAKQNIDAIQNSNDIENSKYRESNRDMER